MTREIIFKAKRIDNGEWVEGCLVIDHSRSNLFEYRIQPVESGVLYAPPINPETICQYTGLTDKNGNRIWENDICDRKEPYPEIVKMYDGDWTLDYSYSCGKDYGYCYCNLGFYTVERKEVEVIGNIFDNPELVKEG
jgi:uncharacterized phage protein (TIGR01671 family)